MRPVVTQLIPPLARTSCQLSHAEIRAIARELHRLEQPKLAPILIASGAILFCLLAWMLVICGGVRLWEWLV